MHHTSPLLGAVTAATCLVLVTGSAQAQVPTPAQPPLTVDQVREAFTTAGYRVDRIHRWEWTSPPATSLQVHDLASGRVLLVLVYPGATAAQAGRRQAEAHEQGRLVYGYGPGVWNNNIGMVQTTRAHVAQLDQLQNDRDCGINLDADFAYDPWRPSTAVDLDFQQALHSAASYL